MNENINVLIPIAGLGSRFSKIGITTPKPLIEIKGVPMIEWAMKSIPFVNYENIIFVVRKEHINNYKIDQHLKNIFSNDITIVTIDYLTEGAACTALLAKEYINNNKPLIVTDCDHYFVNNYYQEISNIEKTDGFIPVFNVPGNEKKWSYTKTNENNEVLKVAEKEPISTWANIGAYYFKKGSDFVWAAETMIEKQLKVNGEYYIAPVYNQLIQLGKNIYAYPCEEVWGLGTPEDVEYFEKNHHDK